MTKARKLIEEYHTKVDVFLELLDARLPLSSRNPLLTQLIGQKPRIILLNKTDLVDKASLTAWKDYFAQTEGTTCVMVSAKDRRNLPQAIQEAVGQCRSAKWFGTRRARGMIVGIPNVGKSSLINAFSGGKKASTAPQAGHTKGVQRIRISDHFELIDTPGILWHKFEDRETGIRLAILGAISDRILDHLTLACLALGMMNASQRGLLNKRFKIQPQLWASLEGEVLQLPSLQSPLSEENNEEIPSLQVWDNGMTPGRILLLEEIGRKRGFLQKGGIVDVDKAALILIQEFREGLLGPVCLDAIPLKNTIPPLEKGV